MASATTKEIPLHSFLPNFCNLRAVITTVVVGELLAIILTLSQLQLNSSTLWQQLTLFSLFIHWLGLSSATILCLIRRYLTTTPPLIGIFSYLVLLANTLLFTELAYRLIEYMELLQLQQGGIDHHRFLLHTFAIAAIIYALLLRYLYMHHLWQRQLQIQAETRYQLLQARIRPHFLFNTLNTIACLIPSEPTKAERAIEDFSELLRATLQKPQHAISLTQELTLCRHYLEIEKLRLGERLDVQWHVEECNTLLPPLLIQPLIENAVYHGIEPLIEGGTITISGQQRAAHIILTISNPLPSAANRHQGHQIAQQNIQQRLALAYGDKAQFNCQQNQGQYTVTLILPVTQELKCVS